MADCERLATCSFFPGISKLPRTSEQLFRSYCRGNSNGCARYVLASKGVRPPDDLFPNESDRALKIIAGVADGN